MNKQCEHCQAQFEITQDDDICLFDKWNNLKKQIQNKKDRWENFIHEREIYFVFLWKNIWIEQNGKWDDFLRPVIVFKKLNSHLFLIIPLTKTIREWSFYFSFKFNNESISTAVLAQIKTIDKKRLYYKAWKMSKKDFDDLRKKLRILLSL